jgi:hypothetical protein
MRSSVVVVFTMLLLLLACCEAGNQCACRSACVFSFFNLLLTILPFVSASISIFLAAATAAESDSQTAQRR